MTQDREQDVEESVAVREEALRLTERICDLSSQFTCISMDTSETTVKGGVR